MIYQRNFSGFYNENEKKQEWRPYLCYLRFREIHFHPCGILLARHQNRSLFARLPLQKGNVCRRISASQALFHAIRVQEMYGKGMQQHRKRLILHHQYYEQWQSENENCQRDSEENPEEQRENKMDGVIFGANDPVLQSDDVIVRFQFRNIDALSGRDPEGFQGRGRSLHHTGGWLIDWLICRTKRATFGCLGRSLHFCPRTSDPQHPKIWPGNVKPHRFSAMKEKGIRQCKRMKKKRNGNFFSTVLWISCHSTLNTLRLKQSTVQAHSHKTTAMVTSSVLCRTLRLKSALSSTEYPKVTLNKIYDEKNQSS